MEVLLLETWAIIGPRRKKTYQREYQLKNPEKMREKQRQYRLRNPEKQREYRLKNREKMRTYNYEYEREYRKKLEVIMKNAARQKIRSRLRSGKIIRPNYCEHCFTQCKPHGHHEDYSKPLDVQWLRRKCHVRVHTKYPP